MKHLFIFAALLLTLPVSAGGLPDEQAYAQDGKLMLDICNKFANEPDAAKLHKAAMATQYARVISCSDYNGECSLYGTFLSLAINVSKDNDITTAERRQMREHLTKLRLAVETGKRKLHKELKSHK